jgi:hypothetical protein
MTVSHALERFLRTDPDDSGCGRAMEVLHVYVDLALDGAGPASVFPGVAVHLDRCPPCAEDFAGLLAAARGHRG